MKLKSKYRGPFEVVEAVHHYVDDIDPYEHGRLELAERRVENLTRLVAELFGAMPPEAVEQVAQRVMSLEVVEESK